MVMVSARAGAAAAEMSSAANACLIHRGICMALRLRLRSVVPPGGIMPRDLGAGRLPHALVPADMGERGIEGIDAMGHAGQIRMDGDRHDAAGLRAFTVEHVELPADHVAELA